MGDLLTNLEKHISRSNPDFMDLSPEDRLLATTLVQENKEFVVKDLPRLIYDKIPIPIEKYLTPEVIGITAETLFPVWKRKLENEIFAPFSRVNEVVFAGATGTGKTHVGMITQVYNIDRILCFKQPQLMFGVSPPTLLSTLMISINMDKAWIALVSPFIEMLNTSKRFVRVKKSDQFAEFDITGFKIPWCIEGGIVRFPKNLILYGGSNLGHTISMSVIGALLDEMEFRKCFSGDTPVKLTDGTTPLIKDLVGKEFYVYSYDYKTNKTVIGRAKNCRKTGILETYKVTLDDGSSFKCTADHRWMLKDGTYKEAQNLKSGESLKTTYFKFSDKCTTNHKIVSVERVGIEDVYDFEVEEFHNFLISCSDNSGVFVHNSADSIAEAMDLYLTVKERRDNRFLDIPWTMLNLISSAKSSEGIIPTYIEGIPDHSKVTNVYTFSVWDVRDFEVYNQGYFYVLKGNKLVPSRLLSEIEQERYEAGNFNVPRNCKMIKIPEAHRETFERNVNRALRNTAGEVAIDELYVFDSYEPFEKWDPNLCPEIHMIADYETEDRLINQIPREHFTIFSPEEMFLKRAPNAMRFCFTGDTKVRLLDSRSLTMEELKKEYDEGKTNWVYSWDKEKGWNPGKIISAHEVRTTEEITFLTLDNGEIIKSTPDHKYMMRDGSYKEAKDILAGQSLMPSYRRNLDGYEELLDNNTNKWIRTHRISDPLLDFEEARTHMSKSDKFLVRHHKDFDKKNNNPDNLELLGVVSHIKFHAAHADKCGLAKQWKNPEFRKKMHVVCSKNGKINGHKNMLNNWHGPNSKEFRSRMKPKQQIAGARALTNYNKSEVHRIKASETLSRTLKDPKYAEIVKKTRSENGRRTAAKTNSNPKIIKRRKLGRYINYGTKLLTKFGKITEEIWNSNRYYKNQPKYITMINGIGNLENLLESINLRNHKVVSVETKKVDPIAVYDLTIDSVYNNHNFVLDAGVVVSNCHIDLAEITEAGLVMLHKELGDNGTVLLVIDLAVRITSPSRIDLDSIDALLVDLNEMYNVQFAAISADRYQSSFLIQRAKKRKLAKWVGNVSVVRTLDAYYRAAAQVNHNLVRIGHAPILHEQAKALKEVNGKLATRLRRDTLDGFAGAIFLAVNDVREQPVYSYVQESAKLQGSEERPEGLEVIA